MIYTSRPVGTSARICLLVLLLAGAFLLQDFEAARGKPTRETRPNVTLNSSLRGAPAILIRLPLPVMVQLLFDLQP